MDTLRHNAEILDQFTKQANPFAERHQQTGDALLALMLKLSSGGAEDSVLDVACGPGIVTCFFANHVRKVTGLDVVPAMLERARVLANERHLTNIEWMLGQATDLPFPTDSFDCVVTRFSLHHYLDPIIALREMSRVCRPKGTVLVADVTPAKETQGEFNRWEILCDPSHTRALTKKEISESGARVGLEFFGMEEFRFGMELEQLLQGSFPKPGDGDRIRSLFEKEIQHGTNHLGVNAHRECGLVKLVYPVTVLVWRKPRS